MESGVVTDIDRRGLKIMGDVGAAGSSAPEGSGEPRDDPACTGAMSAPTRVSANLCNPPGGGRQFMVSLSAGGSGETPNGLSEPGPTNSATPELC